MKNRIQYSVALLFLFIGLAFSQAPQAFKYQAVARNSAGMLLNNSNITVRVGLRDISVTGTIVYQETHAVTTNSFGLINLNIGMGSVTSGTFTSVNWGLGDKFIEVEIDYGTGYVSMGISQLLSVPYALYAANGPAGPIGPQGPAGPQGIQGVQGIQGMQGPIGFTGPSGSAVLPIWQSVTSSATISPTSDFVLIAFGTSTPTFTLPLASSVPQGKIIVFKRPRIIGSTTAGTFYVNSQGSDIIYSYWSDSNSAQTLSSATQKSIMRLISDGISNWYEW